MDAKTIKLIAQITIHGRNHGLSISASKLAKDPGYAAEALNQLHSAADHDTVAVIDALREKLGLLTFAAEAS